MKMPSPAGIDRPFPTVPASDRYLAIGSVEESRGRICRMIDRGEGLGVIIGPPGTGKTLLSQRIASQYRATHAVVMLGDIRVSSRMGLIQQVLSQLRIPHHGLDEQAMQMALVECLTKGKDGTRSLLLLIDEAQMLSLDLLDEIRMLTNLVREGRPLVQTVLVGSPRLEDPLADPQMESLTQRIAARCYLHPMTQAESSQYIRSMVASTGLRVDDDAMASVHHACGGVPRLINQLMNHSLDFAALHCQQVVSDMCVQHAWADLQQLPSPLMEPRLKDRSDIEFGELGSGDSTSMAAKAEPMLTRASDLSETDGNDFATCTQVESAQYVDIEAIFASPIICLPEATDDACAANNTCAVPIQLKTTHTTILPARKSTGRRVNREELFGIDFSDELLVDVKLADAVGKQNKPAMGGHRVQPDPAAEEVSLHTEILKMSHSAKEASDTSRAASARAALPWAPAPRIAEETIDALPAESSDVSIPMAIVWSDDEPTAIAGDDRDILVIEDEVTVMVDPPSGSLIGSSALRQPGTQTDQHYQSLFAKLRDGR